MVEPDHVLVTRNLSSFLYLLDRLCGATEGLFDMAQEQESDGLVRQPGAFLLVETVSPRQFDGFLGMAQSPVNGFWAVQATIQRREGDFGARL